MKKLFYAAALLLISANMSAQSYWAEGYNSNFDEWMDILDDDKNVIGERPAGWVAPSNSNWTTGSNQVAVTFEKAANRNGEEAKACKITTTGIQSTWFTWHISVSQLTGAGAADYIPNPVFIDNGDDFYYTFWAKSDVEGTEMWIGTTELYDPKNNGGDSNAWSKVPKVTLTTNWKQYGFHAYAKMDLTSFSIQTRNNGVRYIDDIVLEYGDEVPELEDPTGVINSSVENPFLIYSNKGSISFKGSAGTVTVFNTLGEMVAQKTTNGEMDQVTVGNSGLYILKLQTATGEVTRKVLVK